MIYMRLLKSIKTVNRKKQIQNWRAGKGIKRTAII